MCIGVGVEWLGVGCSWLNRYLLTEAGYIQFLPAAYITAEYRPCCFHGNGKIKLQVLLLFVHTEDLPCAGAMPGWRAIGCYQGQGPL